jgi:hypothetical protein
VSGSGVLLGGNRRIVRRLRRDLESSRCRGSLLRGFWYGQATEHFVLVATPYAGLVLVTKKSIFN